MSSGTTLFKKCVVEALVNNSLKIQFEKWLEKEGIEKEGIERGACEESERIIAHKFLFNCPLVPHPIETLQAKEMIVDYVYDKQN